MKLRDQIKKIILEQISKNEEGFYGTNSDAIKYLLDNPGTFSRLTHLKKPADAEMSVVNWCEKNIGPKMGRGYSRLAFAMRGNNDLVFKVSYIGEEGNVTNVKEVENFTDRGFQNSFFPKVFARDNAGEWLILEKLDLLISDEMSHEECQEKFDEHIRKNCRVLKNIEGLIRYRLKGEEDAEEMYDIIINLPRIGSFDDRDPKERIAYYFFDQALTRSWMPDIWEMQHVRDLQTSDIYNYFNDRHEEFLAGLCDQIMSDSWISALAQTVKELGIDWGDIGPGNIGIDERGNIKILDISIFEERFSDEREGRSLGGSISWGY